MIRQFVQFTTNVNGLPVPVYIDINEVICVYPNVYTNTGSSPDNRHEIVIGSELGLRGDKLSLTVNEKPEKVVELMNENYDVTSGYN